MGNRIKKQEQRLNNTDGDGSNQLAGEEEMTKSKEQDNKGMALKDEEENGKRGTKYYSRNGLYNGYKGL